MEKNQESAKQLGEIIDRVKGRLDHLHALKDLMEIGPLSIQMTKISGWDWSTWKEKVQYWIYLAKAMETEETNKEREVANLRTLVEHQRGQIEDAKKHSQSTRATLKQVNAECRDLREQVAALRELFKDFTTNLNTGEVLLKGGPSRYVEFSPPPSPPEPPKINPEAPVTKALIKEITREVLYRLRHANRAEVENIIDRGLGGEIGQLDPRYMS